MAILPPLDQQGQAADMKSCVPRMVRKNYCGMQGTQWPTGHGQQMNIPQNARCHERRRCGSQLLRDGQSGAGTTGGGVA